MKDPLEEAPGDIIYIFKNPNAVYYYCYYMLGLFAAARNLNASPTVSGAYDSSELG